MKPSEVLKQFGWTQGAMARDIDGQDLYHGEADHAVCFCAAGALAKAYEAGGVRIAARRKLLDHVRCDSLINWNDEPERTKEEVIAAFEAIGE